MAKAITIVISCALGCALVMLLSRSKGNMNESYQLLRATTTATTAPISGSDSGSHVSEDGDASIEPAVNLSRNHILLLHRKKRYLLFPEGSSFQLVFDLIIPIVDYTNFAILGITCAVAWELPSKPPSELLDNLRTRLNDGTLGTVRRNDSIQQPPQQKQKMDPMDNRDFIRTATNWQSMHAPPSAASTSTYASNAHRYSYYTNVQNGGGDTSVYANSPNGEQAAGRPTNWHARQSIAKWRQWADISSPAVSSTTPSPSADWSDNWWQRNKARVQQNWRQKQQKWNSYEQTTRSYSYTQRPRQMLQEPPKHHIYPVFGKRRRRRRDELQQLNDDVIEQVHLRQHLSSRGVLFGKIERLYKSRQLNGTACIQRALCESAQRQENVDRPQSFIMELLSVIFQLPGSNEAGEALINIPAHYLEAHRERGNCRQLFADCSHTFWHE
ncbi:uncharacterized protein LOC117791191 isoform X2 [Drosophila innubila]|uniref:uncharacterized protein LOC117791191 isoform X2 n=1 Tax=Drosophila innubila TaxID=198719 RepID=UPI00148E3901|nr:uncharacterized protein LOC117791191 isoform X2 [Drosophila innubila]